MTDEKLRSEIGNLGLGLLSLGNHLGTPRSTLIDGLDKHARRLDELRAKSRQSPIFDKAVERAMQTLAFSTEAVETGQTISGATLRRVVEAVLEVAKEEER